MEETFSVWQFFEDESYERVRDHVPMADAATAFAHYTLSVAARMGVVVRVIITDGGDDICMEWKYKQGITFPETQS